MSTQLKLKRFQIALLELSAKINDPDLVKVPRGISQIPRLERQRRQRRREHEDLVQRIKYLKRQHYLERVKESNERLYRLTAKGKYELLRLQFVLHMHAQRAKKWSGNFYLAVFDIPEEKKRYRDFFRKLLKSNGFTMLQLSVWMTRYNPRPTLDALLKYLGLGKYFELMEISCAKCSPKLKSKIR